MTLLRKSGWLVSLLLTTHMVQAQNCHPNISAHSTPDTRYTLQVDGEEVLDKSTQLIWKRCAEGLSGDGCNTGTAGTYTWSQALALTDNTWRLPNIKELASLVETACSDPAINLTMFPNTPGATFWSSSSSPSGSTSEGDYGVWYVSFYEGDDLYIAAQNANNFHVRLVRGGQ